MSEISHETERLLFKLYNLKSSESTIITDILKRKQSIGEMIEEAKTSKEETEQERERLERELSDFTSQKDSFFEIFGGLKDADFEALKAVDVTVSVEPLSSRLSEKAPEYEDSLRSKIEDTKNRIVELFGQISGYGADLDNAEEELQRAEVDRQALASLVEQSLSGNESDSLSKQYIRAILGNFDCFNEEEVTELSKIILFPEDVLSEFDRTYEERKARAEAAPAEEVHEEHTEEAPVEAAPVEYEEEPVVIAPVEEEPTEEDTVTLTGDTEEETKEETTEEVPEEEAPVEEASTEEAHEDEVPEETNAVYGGIVTPPIITKEEEPAEEPEEEKGTEEPEVTVDGSTITFGNIPSVEEEEVPEAPTTIIDLAEVKTALEEDEHRAENNGNEAEEFLTELGFQTDRFKPEELNKIYDYLKNLDSSLIKKNFEQLRAINADDEAYVYANGHMFIADPELSEKITLLRSKSISEGKIKNLLTTAAEDSVFRKNCATIKERVEALEKSDGQVNDDNINYIEQDTALYDKNVELVTKTFELDDKELRNFKAILFSPYVSGDMKVLKEYLLSIVKQDNGRYALNTLVQTPLDLLEGIDGLIEGGLEELITANPEVLELNIQELLRRAEFLKTKGITLYDEESESFVPELVDYNAFTEKYGKEVPELKSYKEANKGIATMVGNEDFTQILVDTLDGYYQNPEVDPEVNIEEEHKAKYEELVASFEEMLKASKVGNLTYQIDDVHVSRNKLERHIKLLLNALARQGQEVDGVEKEIILTALLYNLRGDEEKLKKVADACLGFNKGEEVGGPSL